jgi:MSHA biogenesis protein MshQ
MLPLTALLGCLLAAGATHAQVAFRSAASASATGTPQFRAASSGIGSRSVTLVGVGAQTARETAGDLIPALPSGTQPSDLAVLIVAGRPADTAVPTTPSGWSSRTSVLSDVASANDLRLMTFYRVLAGGEANPTITLPSSWVGTGAGMSAQIAVWRGVDTATPFDNSDVTGTAGPQNTYIPNGLTTLTNGAAVVSLVASADDNSLDLDNKQAQGFTAQMSGATYHTTLGGDHAVGLADKPQSTAGSVTMPTWRQNSNASDNWAGLVFALRPTFRVTITAPVGTAENDVLIAALGVQPSSATITPPAGWTLEQRVNNASATTNSLAVYRKVAGASEPASYSWIVTGATFAVGGIQGFSNVDASSPIDVSALGQATASSTSHATESVTTTVANTMLVTNHTYASSRSWTAPTNMTEGFDQKSGGDSATGQSIEGSYVVQSAAGATGTKTATAAGDADQGAGHILALKPVTPALTVAKPSGTVANDVMIASIAVQPSTTTITAPSGWTLIRRTDNATGNSNSLAVYRKTDGGSEPSSYTWTLSSGFNHAVGGIQSFSGVDTSAPVHAEDGVATASANTHATPSINRSVPGTMLVSSHTLASSRTWTAPAGMTEAVDVASLATNNASGQSLETAYLPEYAWGATGAKTANAGGDADAGNAHILALLPAVSQWPGSFNVFETSTAAGQITGVIKTKVAGDNHKVDVVAVNSAKTAVHTVFADTVKIELLNASDHSGTLDANGCRSSWTVVQTLANVTIGTGDGGRKEFSFNQPESYSNARFRISYPATGTPTTIGCSTDNFALRPDKFVNFTVTDADWETAGTTRSLNNRNTMPGGTIHKAGRPFTVRATAINGDGKNATVTINYAGTATATITNCGTKNDPCDVAALGTLTVGGSFAAGELNSSTATYSNVGAFKLQLVDSSFASVDAGDSAAAEREIKSNTIDVGRFVPNHFDVSANTPVFGTACSGFTYIGQAFSYTTPPVVTVVAKNLAGGTTTGYGGVLWQITNATLTGKSYSAATGTMDWSGVTGTDPVIASNGDGTGTLTFSSGTGLLFSRGAPSAPFDAEISLGINVIDADNVAYANNPARVGQASAGNGISFSADKVVRFGRLALRNANGSQVVPLTVQVEAQYAVYTNPPINTVLGFVPNTADSCTSLANTNIALSSFTNNLSACETAVTNATTGTLSGGRRSVVLAAPGSANNGSVLLTLNLGSANSGTTCTTVGGGTVAATGANRSYLQGNWSGSGYDQNPSARASFGTYRSAEEVIFIRENF